MQRRCRRVATSEESELLANTGSCIGIRSRVRTEVNALSCYCDHRCCSQPHGHIHLETHILYTSPLWVDFRARKNMPDPVCRPFRVANLSPSKNTTWPGSRSTESSPSIRGSASPNGLNATMAKTVSRSRRASWMGLSVMGKKCTGPPCSSILSTTTSTSNLRRSARGYRSRAEHCFRFCESQRYCIGRFLLVANWLAWRSSSRATRHSVVSGRWSQGFRPSMLGDATPPALAEVPPLSRDDSGELPRSGRLSCAALTVLRAIPSWTIILVFQLRRLGKSRRKGDSKILTAKFAVVEGWNSINVIAPKACMEPCRK